VGLLMLLLGAWQAGGVLLSAERQTQNRCSGIRMGRKKELKTKETVCEVMRRGYNEKRSECIDRSMYIWED
jgi:hypothetical protein